MEKRKYLEMLGKTIKKKGIEAEEECLVRSHEDLDFGSPEPTCKKPKNARYGCPYLYLQHWGRDRRIMGTS